MNDEVRNFVLPLISAEPNGNDVGMREFLGTAFLLGAHPGYALTARHVVDRQMRGMMGAAWVDAANQWRIYGVEVVGFHPVEDIALLRVQPEADLPESPFTLETPEVHATAWYGVWGYPEDVLCEVVVDFI